jgi:Cytochrome oxidase complex assembly protein 1
LAARRQRKDWWLLGCGGCGGCLGLIGGGAIVCGVIFVGVVKVIKATSPYQTALKTATESSKVQEALRTPITEGFMPMGNVSTNSSGGNQSGTADITITLKGLKGAGIVHYAATESEGKWVVNDFTMTVAATQEKIALGK